MRTACIDRTRPPRGGDGDWRKTAIGLIMAAAWGTAGIPADAAESGSTTWEDSSGAHIALTWTQPIKVESSSDGRDLVLRFDRPIDGEDTDKLAEALPTWLESVKAGYDSLLLRASRDVAWHVEATADTAVTIDLAPAAAAPARDETALRLGLLRARLLGETGNYSEARAILAALAEQNPGNSDVAVAQSALEAQAERPAAASDMIQRGLSQRPTDPPLDLIPGDLQADSGPNLALAQEYTHVRNAETYRSTLLEIQPVSLGKGLTAGLTAEARSLSTDFAATPQGGDESFYGREQRGALWLQKDLSDRAQAGLAVYGSTRTAGVGGQASLETSAGRFNGAVIYHQPYWETPEGVINGGVVDSVVVGYGATPLTWLNFSAELRGNRYAEDNDHFAASSGGAIAELRAQPWTSLPQLSFTYDLDAEYFAHLAKRFDSDGNPVAPLGLLSREAHRAGVEWAQNDLLVNNLAASLSFGYIWDRLLSDGPYYGVVVSYRLISSLTLEAYADREYVSTLDQPGVTTRVGGGLRWRF